MQGVQISTEINDLLAGIIIRQKFKFKDIFMYAVSQPCTAKKCAN